jgi:tRNA(fMet)-specific endonuclease VapC
MYYVFDTTAYSEIDRGHLEMAKLVVSADEILMPQMTIAELRYGFALGSRTLENEKLLARFLANTKVRVLFPDSITTDLYVELAAWLKKQGRQLSHHDLWIAALSTQYDATLVSFDNDFSYLPKTSKRLLLKP